MNDDVLLFAIEDGVATLTLNRPDCGNAIDLPLAQSLVQAAIRCDRDPAIRCVILTGTGKLFCAGGDIRSFASAGDAVPGFLSELVGTLHMAVSRLMRMNKPLLVAVNGPAAGAGLSLAIAGDVVLAARSAHFTSAYRGVGLSPDGGLSWLLPRLVGMRKAQEMIITDRRFGAEEAEAIGLVTQAVDDDALAAQVAEEGERLAKSAVSAIGSARALLLASFETSFEGHLERETRSIAACSSHAEGREGVAAFLERRKPNFASLP